MKKMISFGFAALLALVGTAEEIESSTITSDIENDYGQNPYGTVCQMSAFLQKTATLKWCSLGTSITWYNDEPRPEVGLTHGYQDRTIEKLGLNKAANFVNRGVSGARIGDANTEPPSGSPCDIYTLEWGINDWMRGTRVGNIEIFRRRLANPNDTCEDITTEVWYTFAASYARVITQIKAINPDAIIILMTPRKAFNNNNNLNNSMREHWWDQSKPDSAQQKETYLYDYVKLIRAIAAETGYPLVDQFRYAANVENLESLSIDKALHPNDAGYEVMANLLAPVMSKAIEEKYSITRCTHEGTTSTIPGTAATCTSDGTTDKTICTNPDCQMVLKASETIPALGHNWGAWSVTTPATEGATGVKERTCQRAGCDAYEELVIPRVGEIVALRNIAVVTKVGELPVLPAQVAGLRADGTVAGQCDVVWAEHVAPSAVGRTTITGTATVDNEAMTVTASVRATVEQSDDDIKNIVLNVPPTKVYPMSGITYPYAPLNATAYANQVNGRYENNSFPWGGALGTAKDGDYNGKYAKEVFVFEFTLAKTSTVKGFTVWHMTDSGWLENPYPMFAEVSTDNGATWNSVTVTGGARPKSISAVTGGNVYKYNYELASPAASVTNLRLKFSPYGIETPEPGDSSNFKGLKISEIEVFGIEGESGGPLEPLTTDTLSALEVDNTPVAGFVPTTYSYTVDNGKAITSATSADNVGITILPKDEGSAYVVTLAENGAATQKYTVAMPAGEEPPPDDPPEDDDVFVNPYADIVVSEAVSNLVKTLTWCSLGTSVTDFNDNPIEGRTQGYQFYTMDKLGWSHDKLLNVGHSGSIVGVANDFPKTTPYDIYTIEFGINDWGTGHPVGTMDDYENYLWNNKTGAVRWNLFAACYRNVIETIRAANPNAIIVLTTPRKGYGFNGTFPDDCDDPTLESKIGNYYSPDAGAQVDGEQTYLEDYAKLIRQIAEEENLVLCDWYAYAADQDNLDKRSVDVAVHPNDRGYEIMAQMLAPKILQAVAAAREVDPPVTGGTLTLDPRGGAVSSTTVELPAASLPTPTREGYHFVGWFKDEIDADTTKGYVRGKYLCGEPLTAPGVEEADKTLYAKWVKDDVYNHFKDKKVVFMGDSVTTLKGYNATSRQCYNNIHYDATKCETWGITDKNTWWGQLVQALDMNLLSVNASSGSPVTDSDAMTTYVRAMSSIERIDDLDVNGVPDVIFIFGGINDFNGNTHATVDAFDSTAAYVTGELDLTSNYFPTFSQGYVTMIRRIRNSYPDTEIVVLIPYVGGPNTENYTVGCKSIADICDYFGVPSLDLRNTDLPAWKNGVRLAMDVCHPIQAGFTELANYVLENYVPACAHEHKTALTGVIAATCTTDGYSGDCTCLDCEKVLSGSVIPALGHLWGEWETTKEPSKTEEGSRKRVCLRDGCDAEETQVIPKLSDVVALRNVAVVTAVSTAPTLPETVKGLKADGTVGGEYSVVWPSVDAPAVEGVTTVTGTAEVSGQTMMVTASVRAAKADPENFTPSSTPVDVSTTSGGRNNNYQTILKKETLPSGTDQWGDYIVYASTSQNSVTIELSWESPITFSTVTLYYWVSGNYQHPGELHFYNTSGGGSVEITDFVSGERQKAEGSQEYIEYSFAQPQTLSQLKFVAHPNDSGSRLLMARRFWVQGGGSVEPQTTDTLTALEVDDRAVQLQDGVYTYEVTDGEAITKAENGTDNVAVTILPKYEGKAYAVTFAEDGESTKTYTVSMPKSHDHVFGEWQVITPATYYASGLRRRVCTYDGCSVCEEKTIPPIPRKSVKWVDVDFANYADGSAIADQQVDPADGGTWTKPSADDTATVAHGDVDSAALVVTNQYLCYTAKKQTRAGRDATVEFKARFQKPTTDALPAEYDLGQTSVFVFPDGKGSCYKAYTSTGWVKLTGATPDFEKFVDIKIELRYEYGNRLAMVTIDDAVCTPVGSETPWFALAGSATRLTSVSFFGEFSLGSFSGTYLTKSGLIILFE